MGVREVIISTPARIHCGLFSAGNTLAVEYGGCGFMLDAPGTVIRLAKDRVVGAIRHPSLATLIRRWLQAEGRGKSALDERQLESTHMEIVQALPAHVGFGSGTQLATAAVVAWCLLNEQALPTPAEIAERMGRARRSGIGVHGFFYGGFLVDRGTTSGETVSLLQTRLHMPDAWRAVVVVPRGTQGLSGILEQKAFESFPSGNEMARQQAIEWVRCRILPALAEGALETFGEAIYEFNRRSGELFRAVQGGQYCLGLTAEIIQWLRDQGIRGVVQSSWGPAAVAIVGDLDQACAARRCVMERFGDAVDTFLTTCNREGARIRIIDETLSATESSMMSRYRLQRSMGADVFHDADVAASASQRAIHPSMVK